MNLPARQDFDVIVIGAGIIGLGAAHELAQQGARVLVIDKGDVGYGCSYSNAGWLTPCFAMPLPMPGMMLKSIKWLMDPESPLYIKPDANPLLAQWLTRFMLAMNETHMHRSIEVLVQLSKYTLQEFEKLEHKHPGEMDFRKTGLLMISNTEEGVQATHDELKLVSKYDIPGKILNETEIKKLEPALTGALKGGVYFPNEGQVEPLRAVEILAKEVEARGGVILPKTELLDFKINTQGTIEGILTTRGTLKAKNYVLATGSWSQAIAKTLKLNVPIMGGKGYAVIVPPLDPNPSVSIMIIDKKIAVTPRNGKLSLAGTLELVDQDFSVTQRRVDAITRGARQFLNLPEEPQIIEFWRGLRPCTPDGVPMIGRPKQYSNLFLCCGHQMLGLQSAIGSGRLVADLIAGRTSIVDAQPFDADRF